MWLCSGRDLANGRTCEWKPGEEQWRQPVTAALTMPEPSVVKDLNFYSYFKSFTEILQPLLKNYLLFDWSFKTQLWQTNCFLCNPTKPFKSLHSAPPAGNSTAVDDACLFRNITLLSFQYPERIDWKCFPSHYQKESECWSLRQSSVIILKESAMKLFNAFPLVLLWFTW